MKTVVLILSFALISVIGMASASPVQNKAALLLQLETALAKLTTNKNLEAYDLDWTSYFIEELAKNPEVEEKDKEFYKKTIRKLMEKYGVYKVKGYIYSSKQRNMSEPESVLTLQWRSWNGDKIDFNDPNNHPSDKDYTGFTVYGYSSV